MDARYALQGFGVEAQRLQQEATQGIPAIRREARKAGANLVGGFLSELGLPRSWARAGGQAAVDHTASLRLQELERRYNSWASRLSSFLETVSEARPRMSLSGNSAGLVARFARTQEPVRLATRLNQGIKFLRTLSSRAVIYNSHIPTYLNNEKVQRQIDERRRLEVSLLDVPAKAPALGASPFSDLDALRKELAEFPNELQALEGAIDAFLGNSQDRFRHAITGARVTLEGVAKTITKEHDWKAAIGRVANEEVRGHFGSAYRLLSSLGPHPGKPPTQHHAELALGQTIGLVGWLLRNRALFKPITA